MIYKFKNSRKQQGKRKEMVEKPSERPKPVKRQRIGADLPEEDLQTSEEYDSAVSQLNKKFTQKKDPKSKTVKKLMDDTFASRRRWIIKDQPRISEVVEKFSFFHHERWVCLYTFICTYNYIINLIHAKYTCSEGTFLIMQLQKEFKTIVNLEGSVAELIEEWKKWEEKILVYGLKEAGTSKALATKIADAQGKCCLACV